MRKFEIICRIPTLVKYEYDKGQDFVIDSTTFQCNNILLVLSRGVYGVVL